MFWEMLIPPKEYSPPDGSIKEAINRDFGSLDDMISRLNTIAAGVQGSGWAWLAYHKNVGKLVIDKTANQDPLEPTTGLIPVLGIDCWEHAYYLQYKNARPDYLKEIRKVINWCDVGRRLENAANA